MTLKITVFGLSITSSWGNGHASTYRALIKALANRGHEVHFLERDQPWYRSNRDLPEPPYCKVHIYQSLSDVAARHGRLVSDADLVVLGSYVPDAIAIGDWVTSRANGVTAFYDIDTPVTIARLRDGNAEYITPSLIPRFDLYLSFTGGAALTILEGLYGSPRARALYCSADPTLHLPAPKSSPRWDLGYLGTYSRDRQTKLEFLLLETARRLDDRSFVVAGAQYPAEGIDWPVNVERIEHLPPGDHTRFYSSQRFTLNVTRSDMSELGYSPSVRLFEAAACGTPVISDRWQGLNSFFKIGEEILVAERAEDVLRHLQETSDAERTRIGERARAKVLSAHTSIHRAIELENHVRRARGGFPRPRIIHSYG